MPSRPCPLCGAEISTQDAESLAVALERHHEAVHAAPVPLLAAEHPLLTATKEAFPDDPVTHGRVAEILKRA